MLVKIISGGQTGVDRAALDAALELGFQCGGWCPKGRRAEDGPISKKYPLRETESEDYSIRTEWNVKDSDGTLIITCGTPIGGTAYTIAMAKVHKKPCLVIDLDNPPKEIIEQIGSWLVQYKIQILNIAGHRESNRHGIYDDAKRLIVKVLNKLSC